MAAARPPKRPSKLRGIRQDPDMRRLLNRLPESMQQTLTDQQLSYLKVALGSGNWRKHPVDIRGTLPLPFLPSSIYFVVLLGRNRRALSRQERDIGLLSLLLLLLVFCLISLSLGLLALYLLKSALGIDLFADFSTGIWHWFQ